MRNHDESLLFSLHSIYAVFSFLREKKTCDGINLVVGASSSKISEGPPEKKAKQDETSTVMVEKVYTLYFKLII